MNAKAPKPSSTTGGAAQAAGAGAAGAALSNTLASRMGSFNTSDSEAHAKKATRSSGGAMSVDPTIGGLAKGIERSNQLLGQVTSSLEIANDLLATQVKYQKNTNELLKAIGQNLGGGSGIADAAATAATVAGALAGVKKALDLVNGAMSFVGGPLTLALTAFTGLALRLSREKEKDPKGFEDFNKKIQYGRERAKVIQGPEAEQRKFGPLREPNLPKLTDADKKKWQSLPASVKKQYKNNPVEWFKSTQPQRIDPVADALGIAAPPTAAAVAGITGGGAAPPAASVAPSAPPVSQNAPSRSVSTPNVTGNTGQSRTAVGGTGSTSEAMSFFMSKGWTKAQAAGIVGNLMAESGRNLKIDAVGDGGKAYGIAQWHPARQAEFKKRFGKDIRQSTFREQLEFVHYELMTSEIRAGNELKRTSTAADAAAVIDRLYERSSGAHRQKRIDYANSLVGSQYAATVSTPSSPGAPSIPSALSSDMRTPSIAPTPPGVIGGGTESYTAPQASPTGITGGGSGVSPSIGSGNAGSGTSGVGTSSGTDSGNVIQLQGKQAATRKGALSPRLVQVLQQAAGAAGVTVKVYSGGQRMEGARGAVGSTRHDQGNAADLDLYVGGRKLSADNPEDRAIMAKFVAAAVAAGATGVGHGNGYMGPSRIHIGFGTPAVWGGSQWIREAWAAGRKGQTDVGASGRQDASGVSSSGGANLPASGAGAPAGVGGGGRGAGAGTGASGSAGGSTGAGTTTIGGKRGGGISKSDVTAAWEKYNESGNPADFARADALMKQWQAQGGDATPQREAASTSRRTKRTGARTSAPGIPLPPSRPLGIGYDSDNEPGGLDAESLRKMEEQSGERISVGQSRFNRWMDALTLNKLKYHYGTGEDPTGYEKADIDKIKKLDDAENKIIGSTALVRAQNYGGWDPVFKPEDLAKERQLMGIDRVPTDEKQRLNNEEYQRVLALSQQRSPQQIEQQRIEDAKLIGTTSTPMEEFIATSRTPVQPSYNPNVDPGASTFRQQGDLNPRDMTLNNIGRQSSLPTPGDVAPVMARSIAAAPPGSGDVDTTYGFAGSAF